MSQKKRIDNPWIQMFGSWILSSLTILLVFWLGFRNDSSQRDKDKLESEIKSKINKDEAKAIFMSKQEGATKSYVKLFTETYKEQVIIIVEPMQQDIKDIKDYLFYKKMPKKNKKQED